MSGNVTYILKTYKTRANPMYLTLFNQGSKPRDMKDEDW